MNFNNMREIYKQVILDHSSNPHNFLKIKDYNHELEMLNPSCGDRITVYLKIIDSKIKNISFLGEGCSISLASSSILTDELRNLSIREAKIKIQNFLNMIMGKNYDENILNDAIVLKNISKLPARVKCAVLSWKIVEKILDEEENKVE